MYVLEAVRGTMLWTMLMVVPRVRLAFGSGLAPQVVGVVGGREQEEDLYTRLDQVVHQLYTNTGEELARFGITLALYSEHGVQDPHAQGQWYMAVDPIGGTSYARLGLAEGVWSVWTIFDADRTPVLGGAIDVRTGEIYITFPEGVRMVSLEWATQEFGLGGALPKPSKEMFDSDTVVSAYLGDPVYGDPAARLMREIAQAARPLDPNAPRGPRPFMWHAGGESTGPYIASGRVHAYISSCEPRSEIDPWLGIQRASGFFAGAVQEDRSIEPYEGFVPELFTAGRVPLFVAAATEQLATEWLALMPLEAIQYAHAHYRAYYAG